MKPTVAVLGGGVGGMSAAHELIERGFRVQVFEKRTDNIPGGKARSIPVPDSATGIRHPLPGEHGFRFFPGFYRHVTHTMRRIPFPGNRKGVLGNLIAIDRAMLARFGQLPLFTPTRFPRSRADWQLIFHDLTQAHTGITKEGKTFFANRIWQLMTSSMERRANDYERLGWWEYLEADRFNDAYQSLLAKGLTRTLVAAKARKASTKTGGDIFIQLLFNIASPWIDADRVLNGPTNDVWLDPWLAYLREQGVDYHFDAEVKRIDCQDGQITGAVVARGGQEETITADYYIAAMPVERMAPLVTPEMLQADATLAGIQELAHDVAWMNGIQFYLNEDVAINNGHVIYSDSPWALTSISQIQFWKPDGFQIKDYGDGTVRGVLSVDISDWGAEGSTGKAACSCAPEEIKDEVWKQLKDTLNQNDQEILRDDMIVTWYLDRDIVQEGTAAAKAAPTNLPTAPDRGPDVFGLQPLCRTRNKEPLLVNEIDTWRLRPEAHTRIPNLFLASDYVRTHTDLATMEGANEAARRAVNGIINASGVNVRLCGVWRLHEPWILAPLRWLDRRRYRRGLPWKNEVPWLFKLIHWLMAVFHHLRHGRHGEKK